MKENGEKGFPVTVRVEERLLTVRVKDIPLQGLLQKIADQACLKIVLYGKLEELVSVDFYDTPLEMGLRRLTRGINRAFIYETCRTGPGEPEITEIIIYPKDRKHKIKELEPPITAQTDDNHNHRMEAIPATTLEALEDEYPVLREEAVRLLSKYKDERTFQQLTEVLIYDEDEDVRAAAAKALGSYGDKRAIEPLLKALQDREVWVRENAVNALGEIGEDGVMPALIGVQGDDNKEVRESATAAIEMIKRRAGSSTTETAYATERRAFPNQ